VTQSKWRLAAALLLLGVLAAGSLTPLSGPWAADDEARPVVTARANTIDGQQVGELLVDGQVALRIRQAAGGYTPEERAEKAAQRLDDAIAQGATYQDITTGQRNAQWVVLAKDEMIVTADSAHARMNATTPERLAQAWRTNIVNALLGQPVEPEPEPVGPGEVDWYESGKKAVPILDVGNQGIRIGAAQVVGPRQQVDQVKAVAQIELDLRHKLRAKVYIPISSLNITKLDRVQGVSVWLIGDLRILEL